jgi:hypothetical protein
LQFIVIIINHNFNDYSCVFSTISNEKAIVFSNGLLFSLCKENNIETKDKSVEELKFELLKNQSISIQILSCPAGI